MARGPELLLAEHAVPQALQQAGSAPAEFRWLDHLDDAPPWTGDGAPLSPGDQMVRQLVQNRGLAEAVREAKSKGHLPVSIAGGCNSSLGVVAGLHDSELGLMWFDAHADAETPETSPDGLFEGMPVSIIAGLCWKRWRENIPGFEVIPQSRIVQIGLHDESFYEKAAGVRRGLGTVVGPAEVAADGFESAFDAALSALANQTSRIYVHIDMDVVDARIVRANKHAAEGGPTPDQLIWAASKVAQRASIEAVSFSSFDTDVDPNAVDVLVPLISEIVQIAARS
jgi:arginase